ncbi:MAG: ROK family protein, partial [Candidatus Promineifilaceae bacterium]
MTTWYGAIEAGGTKFVCAIGRDPNKLLAQTRFPTTTPDETIAQAIAFFRAHDVPLSAIGIASFGPIDPDPHSPTWGYITSTPKPHWENSDLAGTMQRAFNVPVGFDTDVNGAALGEARWGSAQGLDSAIYFTIGTGIGGGGVLGGKLMHGLLHPEMGHMRLPHDLTRDPYAGYCPYHGDCFEGL